MGTNCGEKDTCSFFLNQSNFKNFFFCAFSVFYVSIVNCIILYILYITHIIVFLIFILLNQHEIKEQGLIHPKIQYLVRNMQVTFEQIHLLNFCVYATYFMM